MKSITITVAIIGAITAGAGLYSSVKGRQNSMSYFTIFMGVGLIGTALVLKNSDGSKH